MCVCVRCVVQTKEGRKRYEESFVLVNGRNKKERKEQWTIVMYSPGAS